MPGPPRDDGADAATGDIPAADDATGALPTAGEGGATEAFDVAAAEGAVPVAPGPPPVWKIAGRYRVIARIGSGGMADVMRARDELLARDVAVKVFRATPPTPDTASGVQRQHAELHALAQLNHPNLTMLFDGSIVGQDGPAYLVMELIDGPSLAQQIESGGLSEAQTREVGAQIADALAYVHAAGMVHRDVKPANILLGSDRILATESIRARLTDFGIVRLVGNEPMTRVDMTLGSASYLAPEQARGSGVGPPADIYALGLSLIETLSGRRSFEGPPLEAVLARLASDPEIPAGLPQPWPGLLRAMTARDPADRPTAHQVAQTLRGGVGTTGSLGPAGGGAGIAGGGAGIAGGGPGVAPPPPPPPMPPVRRPQRDDSPPPYNPPPARVRSWLIAAGILIALLIAVGVAIAATSGGGGSGSPSTDPSTSATVASTKASSSASTREDSTSSAPTTDASTPQTEQNTPTRSSSSASRSASSSASRSKSVSASRSQSSSASRTATGTHTTTPPPANAAQPVSGTTSSSAGTR